MANLTIPQEFKLEWVDVSIPLAEYNKVSMVEFEVTNLGNEKISDKLEIVLPNGWDSQFEDTNWIVLDPGESRRVSFELTPIEVGTYEIKLKLQNNNEIVGGIYLFDIISEGNEEYNASLNSGTSNFMIFGLLMLVIALIAGAVILIPKKGLSANKTSSIKLPPLPIIPNQVNIPPIASLPKNISTLSNKTIENDLTPQAKEKIEQYVKQLISTGYPEDKAREHAMKHKDKFLKLK